MFESPAEISGEELDGAVDLVPRQLPVSARVCVQGLLFRGEGVEQGETLHADMRLSSHCKSNSIGTLICFAFSAQTSGQWWPKIAAVILASIATSGIPRPLVELRARPVAVTGGVDDGDVEPQVVTRRWARATISGCFLWWPPP